MAISYVLEAEFTPIQNEDSTLETFKSEYKFNKKPKPRILSNFRTAVAITISKPIVQTPPVLFKLDLSSKIGGFMGLKTTKTQTTVIFDRKVYFLGQTVNIKIICDNSNCAKAVKEFKIKLHRGYSGTDSSNTITVDSCVHVLRDGGCPAHTKVERDYSFTIPKYSLQSSL